MNSKERRESIERIVAEHNGALRRLAEDNAALLDEYVEAADRVRHGDYPEKYTQSVKELREEILFRMNRIHEEEF